MGLVRYGPVPFPCLALADAKVHEPGEARQHVYGRVYSLPVKRPAQDYLPLGYIAREVWYRVRDIVVRHGEYGHERDRALAALEPSGPFVECGKVGVHVAGIAPSAGYLFARAAYLPERFAVCCHVRKHYHHLVIVLECE